MSKVFLRLTQLVLVLFFAFFLLPKNILAANCTFDFFPDPPDQNMKDLRITITSKDLPSGTSYSILYTHPKSPSGINGVIMSNIIKDVSFTSETAIVRVGPPPLVGWTAGTYTFYFVEPGKDWSINSSGLATVNPQNIAACQKSFTIADIPVSDCTISINQPIEPDTPVELTVKGISNGSYDIYINNAFKENRSINSGDKIDLGKFSANTYIVTIKSVCGVLGIDCAIKPSRLQCKPICFTVAPAGSGKGGQCETGTVIPTKECKPGGKDCSSGGGKEAPGCTDIKDRPGIATAIGCIHTSPAELVKDFLTFVIGISGGLAFLMMLLGAFQMLTSAGNPETLNAGRERLTSAAIGLLLVIFAILLLQIIGAGILNIPGFK